MSASTLLPTCCAGIGRFYSALNNAAMLFYFYDQAIPSTSRAISGSARSTAPGVAPSHPHYYERHLFYRLPVGRSRVALEEFNIEAAFHAGRSVELLQSKLLTLRKIFKKKKVGVQDLRSLKDTAYELLKHSQRWKPEVFFHASLSMALERAAKRFLLVDGLWSICYVVGPPMKKDQWWDRFMKRTAVPERLFSHVARKGFLAKFQLFEDLREALEKYGQGERPSAQQIVSLKKRIFTKPCLITAYTRSLWDPWREDDEEFERSAGILQ